MMICRRWPATVLLSIYSGFGIYTSLFAAIGTSFSMNQHFLSQHRQLLGAAIAVFVVNLLIHIPFAVFDAFGEQDAARIAGEAQYGNLTDRVYIRNERQFSAPLYMHLLNLSLRHGVIPPEQLIKTMTWASVLSSALFSLAFFLFMRTATRSLPAAGVMTVLVQVCPFFWLSSLYGFPTMVALGIFMLSAYLFQLSVFSKKATGIAATVFAILLFFCAVLSKVDMVMAAPLFCIPVWQADKQLKTKVIWTVGLLMMTIAAFALLNHYSAMLSDYRKVSHNWQEWTVHFYDGLSALVSKKNIEIIARAAGIASIPMGLVGAGVALAWRSHRGIVIWTLMTLVPVTLFWAMISGNSARHNLIPAMFVTVLMGLPIAFLPKWPRRGWCLILLAVCTVNYLWWPATPSTVKPSGRLIESARLFKERQVKRRDKAREITRLPHDNILVLVPNHQLPTYSFEVLVAGHLEFVSKSKGKYIAIEKATGRRKTFFYPPSGKKKAAQQMAKDMNFHVVRAR
jgi:hypothetical protein